MVTLKWIQYVHRKFSYLKHGYVLQAVRRDIDFYYKKGESQILGKPLYHANPADNTLFDQYFRSYHFEKNFYTNYHALRNLFCNSPVEIPEKFHVYDIACGPYTAAISLLNFLENTGTLRETSFSLFFCDKGDLSLERLYQANKGGNASLFFPVPRLRMSKAFTPKKWHIQMYQCETESRCKLFRENLGTHQPAPHAMNLIFCSYPGSGNESKFVHCISRIFKNFSPAQKNFPTYIIYSHYTGENEIRTRIPRVVNVTSVITSNGAWVPFSSSYYHIFEVM